MPTNLKKFAITTTLPHWESAVREGFYISGSLGDEAPHGARPQNHGTLVCDHIDADWKIA